MRRRTIRRLKTLSFSALSVTIAIAIIALVVNIETSEERFLKQLSVMKDEALAIPVLRFEGNLTDTLTDPDLREYVYEVMRTQYKEVECVFGPGEYRLVDGASTLVRVRYVPRYRDQGCPQDEYVFDEMRWVLLYALKNS